MVMAVEGQECGVGWIPVGNADSERPAGKPSKSVVETVGCQELERVRLEIGILQIFGSFWVMSYGRGVRSAE